ncbi:hypothetical protein A2Z22_01985 [Candidatus Woesebacteria bacterium RBG_16_34_12]|uniref:Novel STAND NTPase 5 domain-containing protein n=1 Tax=Candidatus Woesebacteria bacterium RBG_16_34_12 TaxID=1802480 RepID=A0A1F7X9G3_9BACT|nr:MAG: hypothetical protein A2Z22_01985 [Candidatus Woesebacteria bacterium RBG_16_34_12]
MVSEKFKILVGKVKTRLSDIEREDVTNFVIKEAAGSIPVVGQYIKNAIDEFSPDEKLELLQELKEISQNQYKELSKEIGVSVEYLKDIKTFTYDACAIQKADHEAIKELLLRLIKNQTKFKIGEQKAEIIYNAAGDIIIYNSTKEPVYIPSIESVLRKGETTEGDFFKKEPEWVDYKQGFIVERKEVDEIINRLEKDKVQLVLGAPASGKSIILKNVGYKLANDGKKVYVIELKKHAQDEIKHFFENIPKIDDDSPIFIIDDAHLNISECERLIRNFRSNGKGKLIIGSRETDEIKNGDPTKASEFEYLNIMAIQAEDVTEAMIQTFLKTQYNLCDDRIRMASENLLNFKQDLWYLSWALKVYDLDKDSIDENKIYKNIKIRIENTKASNVFLPLSVFFSYEIPIEQYFLEEQMDIEENIINQLIGSQEILVTEETGKHKMLSLHHSSIAELFFGAYQTFPDFGRRIKRNILKGRDEKDLKFCLFYQYLTTTDSRNAVDVVNYIGRNRMVEKGGLTLLKKLIEEDKIQNSIENGIENVGDIEKIGKCIWGIVRKNKEVGLKIVKNIGIDTLSSKIEKEEDIDKIRLCASYIIKASEDVGLKLAKSIDIDILSSKIEKEEDIDKIRLCISSIAKASEEVGLKLANIININALSSKINKEEDIEKIRLCFLALINASQEVGLKLVNLIDIDVLSVKINEEEDIKKIGRCLEGIRLASKEVAVKLLESIDLNALSSKINKEPDIFKVQWHAYDIAWANEEIANKLVNGLNPTLRDEFQKRKRYYKISKIRLLS